MSDLIWGCSSVGRASRSQCEGRRFDSAQLHQTKKPLSSGFFYWHIESFDPGLFTRYVKCLLKLYSLGRTITGRNL